MTEITDVAVEAFIAGFGGSFGPVAVVAIRDGLTTAWPYLSAQAFREAADLLDNQPLHCLTHGEVMCLECPLGTDLLRQHADDREAGK